jgi:hypothetical protein
MKTNKLRRTRSSSKQRGSNKSSGKDIIMGLIAKDMGSLWQDESMVLLEADAAPNNNMLGVSAEDIFYAQMNGESIEPSMMQSKQSIVSDDDELNNDDIDDNGFSDSFSGLALPEDENAGLEEEDAFEKSRVRSRRSSLMNSVSTSSGSSQSSDDDTTLSMDEIQHYFRESMPEGVKKKIPQEARGRIFGESLSVDETSKPTNMVEDEEEDDDSSVISDISEYTEFIKSAFTKEPVAPDDSAKWDMDICPSLQPDFSPHDDRSVCTTGSREENRKSRDESATKNNSRFSKGGVSFRTDLLGSIHKSEHTKGVWFHTVQVRYYERILDINPAVTSGAAIGLGWRYKRGGHDVSVNEWESQRGDRRSKGLIMPEHLREGLLKELGYTQEDIAEASRIIRKAKDRRQTTVANLVSSEEKEEEVVEMPTFKVQGMFSFVRRRRCSKDLDCLL